MSSSNTAHGHLPNPDEMTKTHCFNLYIFIYVRCMKSATFELIKRPKACFKRRASHVPNALKTIDNLLKCLIIYCF